LIATVSVRCFATGLREDKEKDVRLTAIFVSSLAVCLASYLPATGQEVNLDTVAAQPGAQTTTTINNDGSEETVVKLPNGVIFRRVERNGETRTVGTDLSGHGAVLCSWEIYATLAAALEICPEYQNESLKASLASAVDRINDFIVANSMFPVSTAEVEKRAASKREARLCRSRDLAGMIKSIGSVSHDKLMSGVADLLSVPRPPVMNPCL
jgi:hypothetical protein